MYRRYVSFLFWMFFSALVAAQPALFTDLVGTWRVSVEGDQRARIMEILKVEPSTDGTSQITANYGWEHAKPAVIVAVMKTKNNESVISFLTPAQTSIEALLKSSTLFEGTFQAGNAAAKNVKLIKEARGAQESLSSINKAGNLNRKVHFIYLGGDDCPPCVAWRRFELPKLEQTNVFKTIEFTYVRKTIYSPVPASFFLPTEIKPIKPILDNASGGMGGSPQFAVVVDGKIHDYYWGTRDASQVEKMLISAKTGSKYPVSTRCTRYEGSNKVCKEAIATP